MKKVLCPRCGKPVFYEKITDVPSFPFCSERCRLIDLGKWLNEEHRISEPLAESETTSEAAVDETADEDED